MNNLFRSLSLSALLYGSCIATDAATHRLTISELKKLLESQGFSGGFEDRIRISRMGQMNCAGSRLQVYYYTWEQMHTPYHAAYRVLFLNESNIYLGQYKVSDKPNLLNSNKLVFPHAESDGNSIECDQNGLPQSVLADDQNLILFK